MNANITWVIEWMQCKPTEGQYTDVVINAGWRCNGTQTLQDQQIPITGTQYGSASFPVLEGQFTPYADLTQEQVLGWCWANGVDKVQIEANVQQQIDNQINPPVVTLPLPWEGA